MDRLDYLMQHIDEVKKMFPGDYRKVSSYLRAERFLNDILIPYGKGNSYYLANIRKALETDDYTRLYEEFEYNDDDPNNYKFTTVTETPEMIKQVFQRKISVEDILRWALQIPEE